MKVRIIKDHKEYHRGEVVEVTKNVAFGLIELGVARIDKMMTQEGYEVTKAQKPPMSHNIDIEDDDGDPT